MKEGDVSGGEKFGWNIWKRAMLSRSMMNMGGSGIKNSALKFLFKKTWGSQRAMPVVAPKSFNELWKEKGLVNSE